MNFMARPPAWHRLGRQPDVRERFRAAVTAGDQLLQRLDGPGATNMYMQAQALYREAEGARASHRLDGGVRRADQLIYMRVRFVLGKIGPPVTSALKAAFAAHNAERLASGGTRPVSAAARAQMRSASAGMMAADNVAPPLTNERLAAIVAQYADQVEWRRLRGDPIAPWPSPPTPGDDFGIS